VRAYDIATARWIMREEGSGTRSAFESALRTRDIDPAALDIALVLPSNEAVRSAVRSGPFATVMSELVAAPDLEAGRLVRIGFDMPLRAFRMLRHRERYRTKASIMLEMESRRMGDERGGARRGLARSGSTPGPPRPVLTGRGKVRGSTPLSGKGARKSGPAKYCECRAAPHLTSARKRGEGIPASRCTERCRLLGILPAA
jgi:LysR substrate binding domain